MCMCPIKWALSNEIIVLLSKSNTQRVNTENEAGKGAFPVNAVDKDDRGDADAARFCCQWRAASTASAFLRALVLKIV